MFVRMLAFIREAPDQTKQHGTGGRPPQDGCRHRAPMGSTSMLELSQKPLMSRPSSLQTCAQSVQEARRSGRVR
jgi:hypothetical protein